MIGLGVWRMPLIGDKRLRVQFSSQSGCLGWILHSLVSLVDQDNCAIVVARTGWDHGVVLARSKTTLRFLFWLGLLLFEASLVIAFYVVPLFQPHLYNTHPDIGTEMDDVFQHYPWLKIALIAYWAVFLFGNVGLIVMVWRAFKNLRVATRSE